MRERTWTARKQLGSSESVKDLGREEERKEGRRENVNTKDKRRE